MTLTEFLQHLDRNPPQAAAKIYVQRGGDPVCRLVVSAHVDEAGDVILGLAPDTGLDAYGPAGGG